MNSPDPNSKNALKDLIESHSDIFVRALAEDADLLKALTNAVVLAKEEQKKITLQKLREEAVSSGTEDLSKIDPKLIQKAIKLICGPFNEENAKAFASLFDQGLSANARNSEGISLLAIGLDYLSTKERVELDWPWLLAKRGAQCGAVELKNIIALFNVRTSSLGEHAKPFLIKIFNQPKPWGELEKECVAEKLLDKYANSLMVFAEKNLSDYNSSWNGERWSAIEMLVKMGVTKPTPKGNHEEPFWQGLIIKSAPDVSSSKAKVSAFEQIKEAGWLSDWGCVRIEDGLDQSVLSDKEVIPKSPGHYKASPTRVHLNVSAMDESYVPILKLFQQYEEENGIQKEYDGLGCSRLYYVNARAKGGYHVSESNLEVLKSAAQECLLMGDSPLSVNAQNPLAKSAPLLRPIITSELERQEMHAVLFDVSGASSKEESAPTVRPVRPRL